jgi:GntR family transcriptional regulator
MALGHFSKRPLFLQVRDALAERMVRGVWKPGTAMPNEIELAREYGVSTGTMRKALEVLEGERLISRQQGRGTFVNDQTAGEFAKRFTNIHAEGGERISGTVELGEFDRMTATEAQCERLRLQINDAVFHMKCVRVHRGQPYMVEEVFLPARLFPGFIADSVDHDIVALAQQHGLLMGRAEERISTASAPPAVARTLGIAPSTPIIVLDRVIYTLDGTPIEWRLAQCHFREQYYLASLN